MASPDRYGSGEKPSQFRPPKGWRPSGPVVGLFQSLEAGVWVCEAHGVGNWTYPRITWPPLALTSRARATPRWKSNSRSQLAAAVIPDGNILTRCARLTAFGPSKRHRPGNPTRSIGRTLPMQPVPAPSIRLPVTNVAFSVRFSLATNCEALFAASSQSATFSLS